MKVYTIGFTQTTAKNFFEKLKDARIQRLIDVRLNNVSQLAGFAKRDDLAFFLKEICGIEYVHKPLLAPTQDIIDGYKKNKGTWLEYQQSFFELMQTRKIEQLITREIFSVPTVLLCSEKSAQYCHRRLILEYLKDIWGEHELEIVHL